MEEIADILTPFPGNKQFSSPVTPLCSPLLCGVRSSFLCLCGEEVYILGLLLNWISSVWGRGMGKMRMGKGETRRGGEEGRVSSLTLFLHYCSMFFLNLGESCQYVLWLLVTLPITSCYAFVSAGGIWNFYHTQSRVTYSNMGKQYLSGKCLSTAVWGVQWDSGTKLKLINTGLRKFTTTYFEYSIMVMLTSQI